MDKEKTIKIPAEEYRAFQDHVCDAIPSGVVEYTAFRGCDIYGESHGNDMAGVYFYNCLFLNCRFTSLCIHDCEFTGCRFVNCVMESLDVDRCDFEGCSFEKGCSWSGSHLKDTGFDRCVLRDVNLHGCTARRARLENSMLVTTLSGSGLVLPDGLECLGVSVTATMEER